MSAVAQTPLVPALGDRDLAGLRPLSMLRSEGRNKAHDRCRRSWNDVISNVLRTAPRLRTEEIQGLLDEQGSPTKVPSWDLPLDVCWGTDKNVNGRVYLIFAVQEAETEEKAILVIHESAGPTNLPISCTTLLGNISLADNQGRIETEETFRGLGRLFRDGHYNFRRLDASSAEEVSLVTTKLVLQASRQGFAPFEERGDRKDEKQS